MRKAEEQTSREPQQDEVAGEITRFHATFAFDRVTMLGDNICGNQLTISRT
jgi:hypothetical protein